MLYSNIETGSDIVIEYGSNTTTTSNETTTDETTDEATTDEATTDEATDTGSDRLL